MSGSASAVVEAQLAPENPWPGLDAFEEQARDYFHGRETEAEELLRRVTEAPLTVLFGQSGLGKTSLLKAGLFPRLRTRHYLPVYVRFDVRPQAPPLVDQIRDTVVATIRRERVDAPDVVPAETLWAYLHRAGLELWSADNHLLTPILVLDQFEEVFTLGERVPQAVDRFRLDLGDLAENRIPPGLAATLQNDEAAAAGLDLHRVRYKLLLSLREDFLPDLEGWRRVVPAVGRQRVRLLRMRPDQAFSAVYGPGQHLMDEALARRIVRFIAAAQAEDPDAAAPAPVDGSHERSAEIEPALLSLFCRGLNERRKRLGMERFDERLVESAKQGIIADYYRSCLEGMPEGVSRFIENELITEKGFRNSYARDDAVPAHMAQAELDRLINRRLVRIEERYGTQRIELTHDLLTGAVREHRDRRRAEEEKAALEKRAEAERMQLEVKAGRRFKRLAAVLAVVVVAALGLAWVAYEQSQEATKLAGAAQRARTDAESQRQLAEQRLQRITDGIRMKQAVLAGDRERIRAYLGSSLANKTIAFAARADALGYRNPDGRNVYRFSLFPQRASLPRDDAAVAVVTYRMDHPTFQNALLATGPDRDFTASYIGWGCLAQVVALIEYVSPDRSPEIAEFQMCGALGW